MDERLFVIHTNCQEVISFPSLASVIIIPPNVYRVVNSGLENRLPQVETITMQPSVNGFSFKFSHPHHHCANVNQSHIPATYYPGIDHVLNSFTRDGRSMPPICPSLPVPCSADKSAVETISPLPVHYDLVDNFHPNSSIFRVSRFPLYNDRHYASIGCYRHVICASAGSDTSLVKGVTVTVFQQLGFGTDGVAGSLHCATTTFSPPSLSSQVFNNSPMLR